MNRLVVVIAMLFLGWPAWASAQERPVTMTQEDLRAATAAAQEVLQTYARLVNQQNFRDLGFESTEEIRAATLGTPLQQFMIRLDELREYQATRPALPLLHGTDRVRFPVLAQDATRSSLTVTRQDDRWVAYAFGDAALIRALAGARTEAAAREGARPEEYVEVWMPALNVVFIGRQRDGDLFLTPVTDDARFGFTRGETLAASEALRRMVEAAREHNELPT